jgi:hypothetical protein
VAVHLGTGLVQRIQRSAAQLKLAAGLQGDALPVGLQPDDAVALHDGPPVEAIAETGEKLADLVVGQAAAVGQVVSQLFVLGPDPADSGFLGSMHGSRRNMIWRFIDSSINEDVLQIRTMLNAF